MVPAASISTMLSEALGGDVVVSTFPAYHPTYWATIREIEAAVWLFCLVTPVL